MADPISIATTALPIATCAVKAAKSAYSLVYGIKAAPAHISSLIVDLQGLYLVLVSVQWVVAEEATKSNHDPITEIMLENLKDLLASSTDMLTETQLTLDPIAKAIGQSRIWTGLKWETFKKQEVLELHATLQSYKSTLNLACTSLTKSVNLIGGTHLADGTPSVTTASSRDVLVLVQRDVQHMRQQLDQQEINNDATLVEDPPSRVTRPPLNSRRSHLSLANYSIPLRRYLEETESVLSGSPRSSGVPSTALRSDFSDPSMSNDSSSDTSTIKVRKTSRLIEHVMKDVEEKARNPSPTEQPAAEAHRVQTQQSQARGSPAMPYPFGDVELARSVGLLQDPASMTISQPFNPLHEFHISQEQFMALKLLDDWELVSRLRTLKALHTPFPMRQHHSRDQN